MDAPKINATFQNRPGSDLRERSTKISKRGEVSHGPDDFAAIDVSLPTQIASSFSRRRVMRSSPLPASLPRSDVAQDQIARGCDHVPKERLCVRSGGLLASESYCFFVSHQFRRLARLDSMTIWQKVSLNRRLRSACANRAILISTRILATLNARGDIPPDDSISLLPRRCSSLNFLLATKLSSFLARYLGLHARLRGGVMCPSALPCLARFRLQPTAIRQQNGAETTDPSFHPLSLSLTQGQKKLE